MLTSKKQIKTLQLTCVSYNLFMLKNFKYFLNQAYLPNHSIHYTVLYLIIPLTNGNEIILATLSDKITVNISSHNNNL